MDWTPRRVMNCCAGCAPAATSSTTQALLAEVRHHLTEHPAEHPQQLDDRAPRWVIFATMEWDNGHFLTQCHSA
jgi:hypothetical protein